ncbi:lamin tail domain-containing protein, partial [Streptomyces lavendulae]|uniref:lamin tail domain-containing protein n=1 Tax=Streptomyces lavendulae TaxID=1914 RepID=UPI0033D8C59B
PSRAWTASIRTPTPACQAPPNDQLHHVKGHDRGWTLRDDDGNRYRFDNVRINSHATIRIHTGTGHNTRTDLFQNRREYIWGNRADTATLRDDHNRVVDTETWGRRH